MTPSETHEEQAPIVERDQKGSHGAFFIRGGSGRVAEMTYSAAPDGKRIIIDSTEVSEKLKGQGIGKKLVEAAVAWARAEHVLILPLCPFAKSVFARNPELNDVLW